MDPAIYAKRGLKSKLKRRVPLCLVVLLAMYCLMFSHDITGDKHQNRWLFFMVLFGSLLLFPVLRSRRPKLILITCVAIPLSIVSLYSFSDFLVFEPNVYTIAMPVFLPLILWSQVYFAQKTAFENMLELAGRAVRGDSDGYSGRPFPTGQFQYTRDEAKTYAKWLFRKGIATDYLYEDRIILVFGPRFFYFLPFLKPDLEKCTYAVLDFEGNITVRIAEMHYRLYKEELTFDQLCLSFAELIMLYFRFHKEGQPFSMKRELYHFGETPIKSKENLS